MQFLQQRRAFKLKSHTKGLTIIEVLVSLALLTAVILLAQGFIIPLRVTRASSLETQALSYARSYVEMVKQNWLVQTKYSANIASANWPTWGTTGTEDLKVSTGWTITRTAISADTTSASNAALNSGTLTNFKDTLRKITVTVTPPTGSGANAVTLTTLINRPASGVTP